MMTMTFTTTMTFLVLAGCASTEKPKPTPLEAVSSPQLPGRQLWKQSIGDVGFPLAVAVHGTSLTVADDGGHLFSFEADTGRELWRASVGDKLSAGVGGDGRISAVVSRDNELIVLDGGKPAWRKRLSSRVVTSPLVAGERVFVLGIDRSVQAFDAFDGRKLWTYQKASDALTLAQPGVLMPFKDTLLVGQGSRLVGLDPTLGTVRWDPSLATPRGTNEVERLADLVGPAARTGDMVCARAFQAAVACVNAERGSLLWSRNAVGTDGVAVDEQLVFGADASDRATAWRISDGSVAWTLERLLYRGLTAPLFVQAGTAGAFVVGDSEGFVHWLSRDGGTTLLRMPTDGEPIRVTPVKVGVITVVVTAEGGVFAFRTE
jgi:outer membrane protein assembly factor BamB